MEEFKSKKDRFLLPIKLDAVELGRVGKKLGTAHRRIKLTKQELATTKKLYRQKLATIDKEIESLFGAEDCGDPKKLQKLYAARRLRAEAWSELFGLEKSLTYRVQELHDEIDHLSSVIHHEIEERMVEAKQVITFAENRVRYLCAHTRKVLHEREMTDAERQLDMFKGFSDPVKEKAFKRKCNKCEDTYVGTKRICFNCAKLDEYKFAPEGM